MWTSVLHVTHKSQYNNIPIYATEQSSGMAQVSIMINEGPASTVYFSISTQGVPK